MQKETLNTTTVGQDPNVQGTSSFDLENEMKKLKQDYVPKEEYLKSQEDLKKVWNQWANGNPAPAAQKNNVDIDALRNELYNVNNHMNNLEYISKTLELRKAIMDNGGDDPFVGRGEGLAPTMQDYDAAARVANVLEECIEYAQGDNSIFTDELQRRTNDVRIPRR